MGNDDSYKGWPMYATADALALDIDLIGRVVADRLPWEAASLPPATRPSNGSAGTRERHRPYDRKYPTSRASHPAPARTRTLSRRRAERLCQPS